MRLKKLSAALLACLLFVFSAAGCSKANQADTDAVMAAIDRFCACESFSMLQTISWEESMEFEGAEEVCHGVARMEMELIAAPQHQLKLVNSSQLSYEDETVEQFSVSYIVPEDGGYTEYYSDSTSWLKIHSDNADALSVYDPRSVAATFFVEAVSFCKAGEEDVEGAKALHYTGELAGKDLVAMLLTNGHLNGISTMSENQQNRILDNLVKDLEPVNVSVWLDQEGVYPIRLEMDMSDILKDLEDSIAKTLGNKSPESQVLITDYVISVSLSDFDALEEIVLPPEAASAIPYEEAVPAEG